MCLSKFVEPRVGGIDANGRNHRRDLWTSSCSPQLNVLLCKRVEFWNFLSPSASCLREDFLTLRCTPQNGRMCYGLNMCLVITKFLQKQLFSAFLVLP